MHKNRLHILILAAVVRVSASAQHYESWLDGDYNRRMVTTYAGGDISQKVDVTALSPGLHFYNVRMQDGHGVWGSVNRYLFVVPGMAGEVAAVRYEQWLDGDYDHRIVRDFRGGNLVDSMDVSTLTQGIHYYNLRVQDSHGTWSPVSRYLVVVTDAVKPARISYWIDNDTLAVGKQPISGSSVELTVSVANQGVGQHTFHCRLQDSVGGWTPIYSYDFTIEELCDTLTYQPAVAEYFFDCDPGYGRGKPLSQVGTDTLHFVLSIEGLQTGAHMLYVRSADERGKWSSTTGRPIYVRPVTDEHFTAIEYYFDDTDPGQGKATSVPLPAGTAGQVTFTLNLDGLAVGAHTLNVRAKNSHGLWSPVSTEPFTIADNAGIGTIVADYPSTAVYTFGGYQAQGRQRGLVIIRYQDGKTVKQIEK